MTIQTDAVIAAYKAVRSMSGVTATYARGANSTTIKCVMGQTQLTAEADNGVITIGNSHDFLFLVSELVINGVNVLPIRGDTITQGGTTYTVLTMGGDAQYRYTDQERKIIRVHTRVM